MIAIFLNYAVASYCNQLQVEPSFPQLLDPLYKLQIPTTICAFIQKRKSNMYCLPLTTPAIQFRSLGTVNCSSIKFFSALNYLYAILNIIQICRASVFCYIFYPGHVGLLAILVCWMLQKPYALYVRGEVTFLTHRLFSSLFHRLFSDAQFIICTGEEYSKSLATINQNTEAVIPMSPLLSSLIPIHPTAEKEKDSLTILFVGQIIREKGVFDLLEAFRQILTMTSAQLKLIIIGAGPSERLLFKYIKERKLANHISHLGHISDPSTLASVYRKADLFCLPSYTEGFPRVLYEAMQFSLPIVTTPVGQIPAIIKHGENGLLCEPRSLDALINSLYRLIADDALRKKLGKAARVSVEPLLAHWSGKTHGDQLVNWLFQTDILNKRI